MIEKLKGNLECLLEEDEDPRFTSML